MTVSARIIKKYANAIKSDLRIVKSSNSGVNADVFFDLVELTRIDKNHLAENIFSLSLKTLMRYKKEGKSLNPRNSETALKLVQLFKKGNEIFGNGDYFVAWLNKPAFGLGDMIPIAMMTTNTGIDLISEELIRIEFGAFA